MTLWWKYFCIVNCFGSGTGLKWEGERDILYYAGNFRSQENNSRRLLLKLSVFVLAVHRIILKWSLPIHRCLWVTCRRLEVGLWGVVWRGWYHPQTSRTTPQKPPTTCRIHRPRRAGISAISRKCRNQRQNSHRVSWRIPRGISSTTCKYSMYKMRRALTAICWLVSMLQPMISTISAPSMPNSATRTPMGIWYRRTPHGWSHLLPPPKCSSFPQLSITLAFIQLY